MRRECWVFGAEEAICFERNAHPVQGPNYLAA